MALTRVREYQVDTTVVGLDDPIITLNEKQSGPNLTDIGMVMNRGADDNVGIIWNENNQVIRFIQTPDSGLKLAGSVAISGNAPILTGTQFISTGNFEVEGDARAGVYMQRNETTGLAITRLYTNGVDKDLVVGQHSVWTYEILLSAKRIDGGFDAASFKLTGAVARNIELSSVAIVGSPSVTVIGRTDADWDAAIDVDPTVGALVIKVHGSLGKTVRWVAKITTLEVAFI